MIPPMHNPRIPEAEVDPLFPDRWSPRAFRPDPLQPEQIRSLFEAARWAPSASNEQPWLFVYAVTAEDRARFAQGLVEWNRRWAPQAPLLGFILARTHLLKGNKPNATAQFDTGAAWLSLALQARRLGLYAHAMGGIEREKLPEILGMPADRYQVMAAFVVGYRAEPTSLPADLVEREVPSSRKPLSEVAVEGRFPQS
jgi:nitroreductase